MSHRMVQRVWFSYQQKNFIHNSSMKITVDEIKQSFDKILKTTHLYGTVALRRHRTFPTAPRQVLRPLMEVRLLLPEYLLTIPEIPISVTSPSSIPKPFWTKNARNRQNQAFPNR
jgi:hypothetical protein